MEARVGGPRYQDLSSIGKKVAQLRRYLHTVQAARREAA